MADFDFVFSFFVREMCKAGGGVDGMKMNEWREICIRDLLSCGEYAMRRAAGER